MAETPSPSTEGQAVREGGRPDTKASPAVALDLLTSQIERIPALQGRPPAEILREVPLFSELGDEQLGRLAPGATIHTATPNSLVIREGDYEETFFIILSGRVLVLAGAD